MDFLAQSEDMFTASISDMDPSNSTNGPIDGQGATIGGTAGGVGGALLLIIGVVVVVRRNMERVGEILDSLQRILTSINTFMNRWRAEAPPAVPPRTYPRNLTDAERLQQQHREAAARLAGEARDQHLYATPARAIWI